MSAANARSYTTRSRAAAAAAAAAKLAASHNNVAGKVAASTVMPSQAKRALGDITNSIAQREQQLQRSQLGNINSVTVKECSGISSSSGLTSSNQSSKIRRTTSLKPTSGAATRRDLQQRARRAKKQQELSQQGSQFSTQPHVLSRHMTGNSITNLSIPATSETAPSVTTSSYEMDDSVPSDEASLICRDSLTEHGSVGDSSLLPGATARISLSTDSCSAFLRRSVIPSGVVDIDLSDSDDPLAVSQFANEIFYNFRVREHRFMVSPSYMDDQQDITVKMRAILVDWLVDVHQKFKLSPETLHLTVNIIDRFLAVTPVKRRKLQLVGVTAMLIASKYEEIYAPETADFVYISDKAYDRDEILHMEAVILNVLKFDVTVPSSLAFLHRYLKAAKAQSQVNTWAVSVDATSRSVKSSSNESVCGSAPMHCGTQVSCVYSASNEFSEAAEHFALFLLELCLQSASMLAFPASVRAATSCMIAAKIFADQTWTPTLQYYSGGLQPQELYQCEAAMRALLEAEQNGHATNKLTAIKRKFGSAKYGEISSHAMNVDLNGTDFASVAAFERTSSSDYACMDICCEEDCM